MAETLAAPSIASHGISCSELLEKLLLCLEKSELKDQLPLTTIKEESKRFELWARNIAALQDAKLPSSLEYRIRDDNSACQIVKKALIYVEESLQMALSIVGGEKVNAKWDLPASIDQFSNTQGQEIASILNQSENVVTSASSELLELGLAIKEGITNLFELSRIIRKKPEKDEYIKASQEYYIDPTADIVHVGDKYPAVKKGDIYLMKRLGTAITRRRQYLWYRKKHQKRMEQIYTVTTGVDGKTVWSGEKASTYLPNDIFGDLPLQAPRIIESTPLGVSQPPRTEYADSSKEKSGDVDLLRAPLLPKDSDGVRVGYGEHFECPYCWRPQIFQNKNEWKKHIFSDLRPYVCTFEGCSLNMFESQHQWFDHEMRFHRKQWTCRYCKDCSSASRPDLGIHIKELHRDKLQGVSVDALVDDACQNPRIEATECPLCTEYGANLQRVNQSDKCDVSLKQFQQHLGHHMEQLALAALPQEETAEDDGPASEDIDSDGSNGGGPSYNGVHVYDINEMVSVMGKQRKMPVKLTINLTAGVITIMPQNVRDNPPQEIAAETLTHWGIEGKHVFIESIRPSRSKDLHAGARSTAEEIDRKLTGLYINRSTQDALLNVSNRDEKKGEVLDDFMAQEDGEVTVAIGDEVIILNDKNDEWWHVRRLSDGSVGLVPSSYIKVTVVTTAPIPATSVTIDADSSTLGRSSHSKPDPTKVRTWQDRSKSFTVKAQFLALKDGNINLHKLNGVKIAVPVTKMSLEDLEYVERITGVLLDKSKTSSDHETGDENFDSDSSSS